MDNLDLYARDFNFTIKKKNKVISRFGVFLSFITVGIVCLSFFGFGRNFIYKKNPLILKSIIYPTTSDLTFIEIPHNNFVQFPFRLKTKDGKTYNSKFFEFQISSILFNSTSNKSSKISKNVNLNSCEKALIEIPSFINYYNVSDWICIDFETTKIKSKEPFNFLGSEQDDIFNYLKIELFCAYENYTNPQSSNFNNSEMNKNTTKITNNKCDLNILNSELNKNIYFEYLFPKSYVTPNTSPDPFSLSYMPISIELDIKNQKTIKSYLSYDMALDDVGWILEDKRNFRQFNTPYQRFDSSYLKEENLINKFLPLSSLEIHATKQYTLYTRIFMKMQEVAAQIGGLLNTFHVFFQIFVYFITDSMKNVLINELFSIENKKKKIVFKKIKTENLDLGCGTGGGMLNNQNANNFINNQTNNNVIASNASIQNNLKNQSNNNFNSNNKNINNSNFNHLSSNNLSPINNLNANNKIQTPKNNMNLNSNRNNFNNINNNINININNNFNSSNGPLVQQQMPNNSVNNSNLVNNFVNPIKSRLEKSKIDIIAKKYAKKEKIKIRFIDNFKRRFCYGLYDKKQTNLKYYDLMCDYIDSRLDIIFYFKNLIGTEKFKTCFLNEHELRSFDYMGRLNVIDIEEEMDIKKQDYYKFLDFFCDKLNHKGIKPYDEKILNMMSDDILLEINNFNMGSYG